MFKYKFNLIVINLNFSILEFLLLNMNHAMRLCHEFIEYLINDMNNCCYLGSIDIYFMIYDLSGFFLITDGDGSIRRNTM